MIPVLYMIHRQIHDVLLARKQSVQPFLAGWHSQHEREWRNQKGAPWPCFGTMPSWSPHQVSTCNRPLPLCDIVPQAGECSAIVRAKRSSSASNHSAPVLQPLFRQIRCSVRDGKASGLKKRMREGRSDLVRFHLDFRDESSSI